MRRTRSRKRRRSHDRLSDGILQITALWWLVRRTAWLYRGWRPWSSHHRRRHMWALRR
jgi:hypothetical protein